MMMIGMVMGMLAIRSTHCIENYNNEIIGDDAEKKAV